MPKYCEKKFNIYQKVCKNGKKEYLKIPYTFAIVSAFVPEQIELNTQYTKTFTPIEYAGRLFNRGLINNKLVVSVLCGVGLINATLTAQALIDLFKPTYVLFSGIAGGINPKNNIGDVVIAKQWFNIHHQKYIRSLTDQKGSLTNAFFDFGVDFPNKFFVGSDNKVNNFTRPGSEGVNNPAIPPATNKIDLNKTPPLTTDHFAIPMSVDNLTKGSDAYEPIVPQKFFFEVSAKLLTAANKAISQGIILPKICLNENCSEFYTPIVRIGDTGMTSSTFVDNAEWRKDIFKQFSDDKITVESADMETVGLSMVCESNKTSFLAIRSMSDLAGGEAGQNVLNQFFQNAADNSVKVLLAIMQNV